MGKIGTYTCKRCSEPFQRPRSNVRPPQFCSPSCNVAEQADKRRRTRRLCANECGQPVSRSAGKFCSQTCMGEYRTNKETCAHGHGMTVNNVVYVDGRRRCRICIRVRQDRYRSKEPVKKRERERYQAVRGERLQQYDPTLRRLRYETGGDREWQHRVWLANAESRDQAHHHGDRWTGPELEVASRNDLSNVEVSALIGRTIKAVETMRRRMRVEPKIVALAGVPREHH